MPERCHLCLRPCVTYVPSLYTLSKGGKGGFRDGHGGLSGNAVRQLHNIDAAASPSQDLMVLSRPTQYSKDRGLLPSTVVGLPSAVVGRQFTIPGRRVFDPVPKTGYDSP